MTRSPVPPKTRGLCGTCSGDYQVRDDGRLPRHRGGCDGSRQWPQAYRAPGGKWKAREAARAERAAPSGDDAKPQPMRAAPAGGVL